MQSIINCSARLVATFVKSIIDWEFTYNWLHTTIAYYMKICAESSKQLKTERNVQKSGAFRSWRWSSASFKDICTFKSYYLPDWARALLERRTAKSLDYQWRITVYKSFIINSRHPEWTICWDWTSRSAHHHRSMQYWSIVFTHCKNATHKILRRAKSLVNHLTESKIAKMIQFWIARVRGSTAISYYIGLVED